MEAPLAHLQGQAGRKGGTTAGLAWLGVHTPPSYQCILACFESCTFSSVSHLVLFIEDLGALDTGRKVGNCLAHSENLIHLVIESRLVQRMSNVISAVVCSQLVSVLPWLSLAAQCSSQEPSVRPHLVTLAWGGETTLDIS